MSPFSLKEEGLEKDIDSLPPAKGGGKALARRRGRA